MSLRIFLIKLMLVVITISSSCTSNECKGQEPMFKKRGEPLKLKIEWTKLEEPFPVSLIFKAGLNGWAVGESGWARITGSEFLEYPIKIGEEYQFTDSINWHRENLAKRNLGDEKSFPYVCTPTRIINSINPVVIFARCEHGSQIWSIEDPSRKDSSMTILDFSDSGAASYFPEYASYTENKLLVPRYLTEDKRLQLLLLNSQHQTSEVSWESEKQIATLSALKVQGAIGWMALIDGNIATTNDGGATWVFTPTPIEKAELDNIIGFEFNGLQSCYLFTPDKIYETSNAGKQWKAVYLGQANINDSTSSSDQSKMIFYGSHSILIKDINKSLWFEYSDNEKLPIQNATLLDDKLFIVRGGELFYSNLKSLCETD